MAEFIHMSSREAFVLKIRAGLGKTVEGILEAGYALIAAKKALPHGEWLSTLEEVPFGEDHAQQLMKIAKHPILSNAEHARHLPASWDILTKLMRLPADVLEEKLADGTINPKTTCKEVKAIREASPEKPKKSKTPKAPAEDKLRTFAQEFEARVQARVEAELSKSAKDRLETLVAAHKRKLDAEYEARRRADVDRIVEEKIKPYYKKQVEDYARVIKARRGVLTYGEYEFLLRTLHPDVVARFNDAEFSTRCNTCMQILIEHKLVLLPEKEMTTAPPPSLDDLFVPRSRR